MYENNLFINNIIIFDNTDICIKQYRCENAMWLLSVLEFMHRVMIDRCINSTGHGRSNIYGINGADKT